MNTLLVVILPLICAIDFLCLAIFLLLPKLGLEAGARSVVGDFVVTLGMAFAIVSLGIVVVVVANRFKYSGWAGQWKTIQSVLLSLISGYVIFVVFYISRLIAGGI
jgi:hypothetical protein